MKKDNQGMNAAPAPSAGETKNCKHCKSEIPKKAKVCPVCRKKQGGIVKWIIIIVVALALMAAAFGGGGNNKKSSDTASTPAAPETEKAIEYTVCTVDELVDALNNNALNASNTYKDQYVEVTGILGNIDSNGKYISLNPQNGSFTLTNVQCYIKSDEQLDRVSSMSIGDTVTLRGQITDVGEVLGYSLNIDGIN